MRAFMVVFATFLIWALAGGGFVILATEVKITTVEDLIAAAAGGMIREGPDAGLITAPGDTLVLEPGSYSLTETVKVTLPDVTIRAKDGAVIDARRVRAAIEIAADGVTIGGATAEEGLVIRGAKGPGVVICAEQASEDITIQNNFITDHAAEGILIHPCRPGPTPLAIANIRILANEVRANRGDGIALKIGLSSEQPDFEIFIEDNTIDGQLGAGVLLDATNAEIKKNRIVRNRIGVLAKRAENNRLRANTIWGNLSLGIDATQLSMGQELDAMGNFWGDASGPFHPQKNPLGKGDRVTNGVQFDPWTGKRPEDRFAKFQLTSVSIPEQARVNYEIKIKATLKNIGNAEGGTKVTFDVQGKQIEQVPITLVPQASQEIVLKYTFSSTGEFFIRITAGEASSPDDLVTKFIKVTPPQEIPIATELDLAQAAAGDRRDVAPGDTLVLERKTYRLSKPVIVKLSSLTIRSRGGAEATILDGSGLGPQAMLIVQEDSVTIEALKLINAPAEAMIIQSGRDITVQKMIITGSDVGVLLNTTGVMFLESEISKNRIGIKAQQAKDNAIHRNRFINNREYGIDASALPAGQELDATKNFWGDSSGPRHPSNPRGRGDRVTDGVRFRPFLRDGEGAPPFDIELLPNPIADRAEFIVRGPNIASFRVEVFDLAGRKVFEAEEKGSRLRFLGLDQRGKKLANGLYLYVVTLKKANGTLERITARKLLILR